VRTATILHTEWSNGWGGQEIRIVEEAKGIAERGHRVLIAARPECKILEKARAAGLETRPIAMRNSLDMRAVRQLCALIRAENADVLNTHSSVDSWLGAFAAKLTGTKLVRTRHLSTPVARHWLNVVHRMPDAVITTGEAVRQQLIQKNRLRADKVVSIPTGVDIEFFSPRAPDFAAKTALGLPETSKVVSVIAVLRRFKRHDLFLEAAKILTERDPTLRFLIVGEGPQRANIVRLVRERGLSENATLTGHCDDVRPILSFSDVVALSSDSNEGVPQSITQALAMARPVVATNVGGVGELVQHERTGLLVPPLDPQALAAAVTRFLREPKFGAECGARGREHIRRNFSREQMLDRTLELYWRLLG
jgi:glycosyltransferase involved in cell wall biosynthesis